MEQYKDPYGRPGGPHRDTELTTWLNSTGHDHNEFTSRELALMQRAWDGAHGKSAPAPGMQFADFTWPARWNKGEAVAMLSQSGADVMAVGFFGTLKFQLDDPESVAAIVNSARKFADMVEQTAQDHAAADIGG